jgi:hypothetical protein
MIPDQRQARSLREARWRQAGRPIALALVSCALAIMACDKVALVAPSGATITLFTNAQFLPVNGSADITASVIEDNGYPVQNGTTVTFTTSLGTVEPTEAKTKDGKATVRLLAGQLSGTAQVNAFSGSNEASAAIEILIGGAAVQQVLVSASPSTVPSTGGSVQVVATVQDAGGNALPGVPVNFATDFGRLNPDTAVSDASGHARSTLTTSQTATITVRAGAQEGTATVTALPVPTVSITPPDTTPSAGVSASFTIEATAGDNSSPIREVEVSWGDGSEISLGALNGSRTVPHTYRRAGTFTVRVTATDAAGQTVTTSVPIEVFPAVPFILEVAAASGRVDIPITATATLPPGAPPILRYEWDFGDGTTQTTSIPTVTHTYTTARFPPTLTSFIYTIQVTARGADGRDGFGSAQTTITR